MREQDIPVLTELATSVSEGVILEIGSWQGASSAVIGRAAQVPVYCIDMWDLTVDYIKRRPEHKVARNYELFSENTRGLNVTGVKGISAEIAKVWDKPIGLLFIDGNHSYEECKADYNGFAKHIIPGGYLVFHDYEDKFPGVQKLVDEIKDGWTGFTVEGSIAVLRKRGGAPE